MALRIKSSYVIALAVAAAAFLWVLSGSLFPSGNGAAEVSPASVAADKEPMRVRVRDLMAEQVVNDVLVTGRTEAVRTVRVAAEAEGRVAALLVDKGDVVTAGQVLARLEEQDRRARVAETAERTAQFETEFNAASALESQGFNSRIRLAQARADFEAARAAQRRAEVDLANTEITAPFDGVVHERLVSLGDYAGMGDVLFSVVDLDPIRISGYVTEQQVSGLTPGVTGTAELGSGDRVEGALRYIAPAADPQTRTFRVEIEVPNPDHSLIEGLTARVRLPAAQVTAHKISPAILALNDEGQIGVKLVDGDNIVQFQPVRIIADTPQFMWIDGLPQKARVITVGQEFVLPGQKVTPVSADGDGHL